MTYSPKEMATAIQKNIEVPNPLARKFISPTHYKQHNLHVADGVAPIRALLDSLPHHKVYTNVVRAFQDGDYGFVHVDYHLFGPVVAFDIHRFEDGMSVEHWDNLQDTPLSRNKSGRTMTDGKTQAKDHDQTEANKALARQFVQEILVEGRTANVATYFEGNELVQHNPHMGDGVAELLAVRAEWEERGTPARYDKVHKVLGEGNFVLVLSEGAFLGEHAAFYDLYRIEAGKIAEHWDVIEAIPSPENQKNRNGKF